MLLSHLTERLSLRFPLSERIAGQWHFCVALSGGRDSVALLAALHELCPGQVSACHVHHGLSPNADRWAAFCAELCASLAIPLQIFRVQLHLNGQGVEAAARQARYAAFANFAQGWRQQNQNHHANQAANAAPRLVFCLAQHREDQAETVLLKLLRGSGVKGAAGMWELRVWREMQTSQTSLPNSDEITLWRPLLNLPRRALEEYLAGRQLMWIEDESNQDQHYRRNFLRQAIFPQLQSHFPAAATNLARAAQHFQDAESILQEVAATDKAAIVGRYGLKCAELLALSAARQHNLLRYVLEQTGEAMPEQHALAELLRQVAVVGGEGTDQAMAFPLARHTWQVAYGELCLVAHYPLPPTEPVPWQGEAELPWAGGVIRFERRQGQGLSLAKLQHLHSNSSQQHQLPPLYLHTRQGGERLKIAPNRPSQSLKHHWQSQRLPRWERERWPLLFATTKPGSPPILLWCPEFGLHCDWQVTADEIGYFPIWSEK